MNRQNLCIVGVIEVHFESFISMGKFTSFLGGLWRSSHPDPLDTGRILNVDKTFNLRPVSTREIF